MFDLAILRKTLQKEQSILSSGDLFQLPPQAFSDAMAIIKACGKIDTVMVGAHQVRAANAPAFFEALSFCSMRHVLLCQLYSEDVHQTVLDFVGNFDRYVTEIFSLNQCDLKGHAGLALMKALERSRLKEFNFIGWQITDDLGEAFGDALKNHQTLVKLNLSRCRMSKKTLRHVAASLPQNLEFLMLTDMALMEEDKASFSESDVSRLKLNSLRELYIDTNNFDPVLSHIANEAPALEFLKIRNCGLEAIQKLVREKQTLRNLNISSCKMSSDEVLDFLEAMQNNETLASLVMFDIGVDFSDPDLFYALAKMLHPATNLRTLVMGDWGKICKKVAEEKMFPGLAQLSQNFTLSYRGYTQYLLGHLSFRNRKMWNYLKSCAIAPVVHRYGKFFNSPLGERKVIPLILQYAGQTISFEDNFRMDELLILAQAFLRDEKKVSEKVWQELCQFMRQDDMDGFINHLRAQLVPVSEKQCELVCDEWREVRRQLGRNI